MTGLAIAAVLIVAALHVWFVVLEMVLWTRPAGRRVFGTTAEFADASKALAANQGLYNAFLVAGLLWGIGRSIAVPGDATAGLAIVTFFLVCVIVAGVFGALTVSRRIVYVQALPALVALALAWLQRPG